VDDRRGAGLALAAWIGSLLAAIALFTWLGGGRLGAPPLTRPGSWAGWVGARSAPDVVFALGRVAVLGLAWYLVGVTTLSLLARWARSLRLLRVADALAFPSVRRLMQACLGLGLATAAVASSSAQPVRPWPGLIAGGPGVVAAASGTGAGDPGPSDPPTDPGSSGLPPEPGSSGLPTEPGSSDPPTDPGSSGLPTDPAIPPPPPRVDAGGDAVHDPLWYLGRPEPLPHPTPPAPVPSAPVPSAPTSPALTSPASIRDVGGAEHPAQPPVEPEPGTPTGAPHVRIASLPPSPDAGGAWLTQAGDHFWSIAERVVAGALDREPAEREVAAYWRLLIAANQDRLVHPGNPDLVYPGQSFVLPPVTA